MMSLMNNNEIDAMNHNVQLLQMVVGCVVTNFLTNKPVAVFSRQMFGSKQKMYEVAKDLYFGTEKTPHLRCHLHRLLPPMLSDKCDRAVRLQAFQDIFKYDKLELNVNFDENSLWLDIYCDPLVTVYKKAVDTFEAVS